MSTCARNGPPLAVTGFVKFGDQAIFCLGAFTGEFLKTGGCDPMTFSFGVEIRVKSTIVRMLHIAVTRCHNLHRVAVFDSVVGSIDKILVATVNFLEEEIFVLGFLSRIHRQHVGDIKAVSPVDLTIGDDAGVGAEAVVNDLCAVFD